MTDKKILCVVLLLLWIALLLAIKFWLDDRLPRIERDKRLVLRAFVDALDIPGPEIGLITKLGPHRLYPALNALEVSGVLNSYWEGGGSATFPRRRRYMLTVDGAHILVKMRGLA